VGGDREAGGRIVDFLLDHGVVVFAINRRPLTAPAIGSG